MDRRMIRRIAERAHFGVCHECGAEGMHYNIYKHNFFACDEHELVWHVGCNLLSNWRYETTEDWLNNWDRLRTYRTIDGFGDYDPGPPLGEQATLEELMPEWADAE